MTQPRVDQVRDRIKAAADAQAAVRQAARDAGAAIAEQRAAQPAPVSPAGEETTGG